MPKARAAELHERFAAFLESDEVEEERGGPQIAWHLEQAARLRSELRPGAAPPFVARRAAELLEEEGRQALAHDEPQAAASLLSRATALAPETTTSRAALQEALVRSRARPGGGGARGASGKLAQGDNARRIRDRGARGRGRHGRRLPGAGSATAARSRRQDHQSRARTRPGFRERFERESRIAAQIEHPNVIPVYRAGEDGGRLFMAMRYVDGTDLASVLSRRSSPRARTHGPPARAGSACARCCPRAWPRASGYQAGERAHQRRPGRRARLPERLRTLAGARFGGAG